MRGQEGWPTSQGLDHSPGQGLFVLRPEGLSWRTKDFMSFFKSECLDNLLQKEDPYPEIQSHIDYDVQATLFIRKK